MGIAGITLFSRYEEDDNPFFTSKAWETRMEKAHCKPAQLDPARILHYRHFEHSMIVGMILGAIYGQLCEAVWFVNRGLLNQSQASWFKTEWYFIIARVVIMSICMIPCMIGRKVFPDMIYEMHEDTPLESRVALYACLANFLPFFLTGFVAFGFMRLLFTKLSLDNPQSIGKEFEEISEKYHA